MSFAVRSIVRLSRNALRPTLPPRIIVRTYAASGSSTELSKTPLYDFHISNGAKMVPFAGFSMPLSYSSAGQVDSHNHVRNSVGLFDVSHMVQSYFRGLGATQFLEWLTPSDLAGLGEGTSTLSVLLNEKGGIIDDTIITKHTSDVFYVVTNAGCRDNDLKWINQKLEEWNSAGKPKVSFEVLEGWGLVALQGPKAAEYLQSLTSFDLKQLTFGKSMFVDVGKYNVHVARGGYTGEDGFEISIPPAETVEFTRLVYQSPVELIGLGARDSLRLEAGMCLYGSDLDETTTPVEAGLSWLIGKTRRETGGFIGAETVQTHLKEGPPRRRVGIVVDGAPARHGAKIFKPSTTEEIGLVTSGIPSPTLGKNIAMAYVANGWHKKGTEVEVEVRNKKRVGVLTPMPFVKTGYWRG